jgi:hypothetical protein
MLVSLRYCRRKLFRLMDLAHRRAQDIVKWVLQLQVRDKLVRWTRYTLGSRH